MEIRLYAVKPSKRFSIRCIMSNCVQKTNILCVKVHQEMANSCSAWLDYRSVHDCIKSVRARCHRYNGPVGYVLSYHKEKALKRHTMLTYVALITSKRFRTWLVVLNCVNIRAHLFANTCIRVLQINMRRWLLTCTSYMPILIAEVMWRTLVSELLKLSMRTNFEFRSSVGHVH